MSKSTWEELRSVDSFLNRVSKRHVMLGKKAKRLFKKKEAYSPFLHTVKVYRSPDETVEAKMILDTGCQLNLISYEVVECIQKLEGIQSSVETVGICLNGETLKSIGTITLRWKGRYFRKIYETTFHIIAGENLPWQVILGAQTIQKEGILAFGGFGLTILPKKNNEEKANEEQRRKNHAEEVAKNAAAVAVREECKDKLRSGPGGNGTTTVGHTAVPACGETFDCSSNANIHSE